MKFIAQTTYPSFEFQEEGESLENVLLLYAFMELDNDLDISRLQSAPDSS